MSIFFDRKVSIYQNASCEGLVHGWFSGLRRVMALQPRRQIAWGHLGAFEIVTKNGESGFVMGRLVDAINQDRLIREDQCHIVAQHIRLLSGFGFCQQGIESVFEVGVGRSPAAKVAHQLQRRQHGNKQTRDLSDDGIFGPKGGNGARAQQQCQEHHDTMCTQQACGAHVIVQGRSQQIELQDFQVFGGLTPGGDCTGFGGGDCGGGFPFGGTVGVGFDAFVHRMVSIYQNASCEVLVHGWFSGLRRVMALQPVIDFRLSGLFAQHFVDQLGSDGFIWFARFMRRTKLRLLRSVTSILQPRVALSSGVRCA